MNYLVIGIILVIIFLCGLFGFSYLQYHMQESWYRLPVLVTILYTVVGTNIGSIAAFVAYFIKR